jgi:hypothetical protein
VIGGDLNLPTLQLAQSGVDRRALSGERETADETAFRALLAATHLTVKSGTIAACGPTPHHAITRVQPSGDDVQFSELDFIVANDAACVSSCVTENCGPRATMHGDEVWARSDHCPLWCIAKVLLEDAVLDLSSLGWHPSTPRADWALATAEQRVQLPIRIKDDQSELVEALRSTKLASWAGHWKQAVDAYAAILVDAETAVIGRRDPPSGPSTEIRADLPWYFDDAARDSERAVQSATAELRRVITERRDSTLVGVVRARLKDARTERAARIARCHANVVSGRRRAAPGDYRGVRAAACVHVKGILNPDGAKAAGEPVNLGRGLYDASGEVASGIDAVRALEASYEKRHRRRCLILFTL